MPIRFTKRRLLALGLMLGLFVVVLLFDWNWLRSPLAAYLSARLGREVTLQGNLEVGLSRQLFLQADEVVLANAAWAGAEPMAQAARVALRVDLGALWSRRLVLSEIVLVSPRLLLERNARGEGNWVIREPSGEAKAPPALGSPTITGCEVILPIEVPIGLSDLVQRRIEIAVCLRNPVRNGFRMCLVDQTLMELQPRFLTNIPTGQIRQLRLHAQAPIDKDLGQDRMLRLHGYPKYAIEWILPQRRHQWPS